MIEPVPQRIASRLERDIDNKFRYGVLGRRSIRAEKPVSKLPIVVAGLVQRRTGIEERMNNVLPSSNSTGPYPQSSKS